MTARPREPGLDLIRAVASVMVVAIHVSSASNWANIHAPHWFALDVYDSLSRPCIPLFLMITGALLVPREPNLSEVWYRIWRIAIPLVVWSEAYLLKDWYDGWRDLAGVNPLQILRGPVKFHLWYFYTLIGLYLFLPVLQSFFRGAARELHLLYILTSFLAVGTLPIVANLLHTKILGVDFTYFPGYAAYLLLGAVLNAYRPNALWAGLFLAIGVAAGILVALGTLYLSATAGKPQVLLYDYSSAPVAVSATALFLAMRWAGEAMPAWVARVLLVIAPSFLGIYILHIFVLLFLAQHGLWGRFINPWGGIPIVVSLTWILSLVASLAIRRIPLIGRYVLP